MLVIGQTPVVRLLSIKYSLEVSGLVVVQGLGWLALWTKDHRHGKKNRKNY